MIKRCEGAMGYGHGSGRQAGGRRGRRGRRRLARELRAKTYDLKEETVESGGEENLQEEGKGGGVEKGLLWECQAALGGVN